MRKEFNGGKGLSVCVWSNGRIWQLQNGSDCKRCYCFLIKEKDSFQFLKRQNWLAILDFLFPMSVVSKRKTQMERKWTKFGKLHRFIWNRKINNAILTLCVWSCRNETNRERTGEEFPFLLPAFVEWMEIVDDNVI